MIDLLIDILISFIKVGAFSFGGGYAIISFIQKEIIQSKGWLDIKEFVDIVAIAEITPGPIAVNASTYVGYKAGGIFGSLIGTMGVLLVPMILTLILAIYFDKFKHLECIKWILNGIRPAVLGIIGAACFSVAKVSITDLKSIVISLIIFISIYRYRVNPIIALAISGGLGILYYYLPF